MSAKNTQRIVDADHPWLGLSSFTEATQGFFYGRDREIRELFLRVREQPLTILYGQSGLGKTSLLGAGLIPKLKVEGFRPALVRLEYDDFSPSLLQQTFSSMMESDGQKPVRTTTLWEQYHHIPSRASDLAAAPPVLIFDQFEEVFTLGQSEARKIQVRELILQLADLIENRPPAVVQDHWQADRKLTREYDLTPSCARVIITLREDFLSQLEAWKKVMPSLMRNRMAVQLLTGPQALEAVVRPGRTAGRHIVSDEVGTQIVRFIAKSSPETPLADIAAVPPLLSLICDELNEARIVDGASEITGKQVVAQSADILQNFYIRSFDGLPTDVQRFIEFRLVTVGGHRNAVAREDAIEELAGRGVVDPAAAIDQLIQRRLLSAEERGRVQRLEITHDVLAPLVVRSRDDRRAREARETAEQQLLDSQAATDRQSRQLRRSQLATAMFAALTLFSMVACLWAWRSQRAAVEAKQKADEHRIAANDEKLKADAAKETAIAAKKFAVEQQSAAEASAERATQAKEAAIAATKFAVEQQSVAEASAEAATQAKEEAIASKKFAVEQQSAAEASAKVATQAKEKAIAATNSEMEQRSHAEEASVEANDAKIRAERAEEEESKLRAIAVYALSVHEVQWYIQQRNLGLARRLLVEFPFEQRRWEWKFLTRLSGLDVAIQKELRQSEAKSLVQQEPKVSDNPRRLTGPAGSVRAVAFSPDGKFLASVMGENWIQIWNTKDWTPYKVLTGHAEAIRALKFIPGTGHLASASLDRTVRIWDITKQLEIHKLTAEPFPLVFFSLATSPDGSSLYAGGGLPGKNSTSQATKAEDYLSWGGRAVCWNTTDYKLRFVLGEPPDKESKPVAPAHTGIVRALSVSADGKILVTGGYDAKLIAWNAETGKVEHQMEGHEKPILDIAFDSSGARICSVAGPVSPPSENQSPQFLEMAPRFYGSVRAWNVGSGREIAHGKVSETTPLGVIYTQDETRILTISRDQTLRIWDANTLQHLLTLPANQGEILSMASAFDGDVIATGGSNGTVLIWDARLPDVVKNFLRNSAPAIPAPSVAPAASP